MKFSYFQLNLLRMVYVHVVGFDLEAIEVKHESSDVEQDVAEGPGDHVWSGDHL